MLAIAGRPPVGVMAAIVVGYLSDGQNDARRPEDFNSVLRIRHTH